MRSRLMILLRSPLATLSLVAILGIFVAPILPVRAQDLNATLEAELDAIENSSDEDPASAGDDMGAELDAAATEQGAGTEAGAGVADDLEDDLQVDLGPEPEAPLESSIAPPAKKAKARPRVEPTVPVAPVAESVASSGSLAPASDEPNSDFEARLSQIYSSGQNSDPISDEKWSGLLGSRAAEAYSIQAGDTLWDLSQTLFADGFYWSKLWAENPEIQNPHKISKGQAIRFIGGTEAAPPEVRVVEDTPVPSMDEANMQLQLAFEKEDAVPALIETSKEDLQDIDLETAKKLTANSIRQSMNGAPQYREDIEGKITQADLDAGVVVEQTEIIPRPIIPPPSEPRRPVLRDLPRSFRTYVPFVAEKNVSIQRRVSSAEKIPGAIVPSTLAFEQVPESMGTVVEIDAGEGVASIGQAVFIRGNESLQVGSKLYSITNQFDVRSDHSGRIGTVVEIGGILRIVAKIDEDDNLYRAQVVYAVNPVALNSDVLLGEPPRIRVTTKGRQLPAELEIAAGGEVATRRFFGDGAIVYLDTKESGVRVGDVLSVQARRGGRKVSSRVPDQKQPAGILKVFAVSGKVASAVIVLATEEVRVGDLTGAPFPSRLPDFKVEPPKITKADAGDVVTE